MAINLAKKNANFLGPEVVHASYIIYRHHVRCFLKSVGVYHESEALVALGPLDAWFSIQVALDGRIVLVVGASMSPRKLESEGARSTSKHSKSAPLT